MKQRQISGAFPAPALAGLLLVAGAWHSRGTTTMELRADQTALERLRAEDGRFVGRDGTPVTFWGVNLVSAFFEPEVSRATAENLRSLGVNLVRHHHLLRLSRDWCYGPAKALARYETDSRTPDPEAWARFDALNAALRAHNIRITLSAHFSRKFHPGDVSILPGEDAEAWREAIAEINGWDWRRSIDPIKLLPVVDERCRLLQKEFARELLTHVNPHTGMTYGDDPQVLYLELLNESSLEYAIICGNRFPAYFEAKLERKWEAFCVQRDAADAGSLWACTTPEQLALRSDFLRAVEDGYYAEMRAFLRELAPGLPVVVANLWRGNDALRATARFSDLMEDHSYPDPWTGSGAGWWMDDISRTKVAGKPYVLGEFNYSENPSIVAKRGFARPQLMLAAAAYGAFHGVDGIVWFAWNHGDRAVAPNGWAKAEGRSPTPGDLVADGVMLDHMATCAALYRLVAPARQTHSVFIDTPQRARNYNALMQTSFAGFRGGSLSCLSLEKTFDEAGADPIPGFPAPEDGCYRTDTGEVERNLARGTLTVRAPCAEAFSGDLNGEAFPALPHVTSAAVRGFATVILVSLDGRTIGESRHLALSRTLEDSGSELPFPLTLRGLAPLRADETRVLRVVRPRVVAEALEGLLGSRDLPLPSGAEITLPAAVWTQAEVVVVPQEP